MTMEEIKLVTIANYLRPESLSEAYELNQKKANRVLGGMMWLRLCSPRIQNAIDLSGLYLDYIRETEDAFEIGAMCSLRSLETHPGLEAYFCGAIKESVRHIVGVQFRNQATVGGSIYGRFGFSDVLTCLLALDTEVVLVHAGKMTLAEFADRKRDRDILEKIIIKKDGRRVAYLSQRATKTDFPVAACAVSKKEDTWYVSVGARPAKAELAVIHGEPAETLGEKAVADMKFGSNMRGSAEYREAIAKVLVRRAANAVLEES